MNAHEFAYRVGVGAWRHAPAPLGMAFDGRKGPIDPYLVWFHETQYAGINPGYTTLPVMVELRDRWDKLSVIEKVLLDLVLTVGLPFDTSRFLNRFVKRSQLDKLVALQVGGLLRRIQLAVPRGDPVAPSPPSFEVAGFKGQTIFGVIDDGCCIANPLHWQRLKAGVESRIFWVWDQDPMANLAEPWRRRIDRAPDSPGYGLQTDLQRIGESLGTVASGAVSERDYYGETLGRPRWGRAGRTHGGTVLNRLLQGDADTRVIFVSLPEVTVGDSSGGSLGFYVLDGVRYIVERASGDPGMPWHAIVNISVGSVGGPHDGTTMTEEALEELVGDNPGHVQLVMAAGNTSGLGLHARHTIQLAQSGDFHWLLRPGNVDEAFLEVWLPANADDGSDMAPEAFSLEILVPGATVPQTVTTASACVLPDDQGRVIAGVIFAKSVSQGRRGTMVLIAVRPTERRIGSTASIAPAGVWRVTVKSSAAKSATVRAWVERNETIIGRRTGQRTRLVGAGLSDEHTLSSMAHGPQTMTVGAYTIRPLKESAYSALGPVLGAPATSKPQAFGPSDESPWMPGVAVPGFFSATAARLSGTSAAAPRVARWIAQGRDSTEETVITRRDDSIAGGAVKP
jgi:hypothetical protein